MNKINLNQLCLTTKNKVNEIQYKIQQLKLDKVDNEKDLQMEVKKVETLTREEIKRMKNKMKSAKEEEAKLVQELFDQKESLKLLYNKNQAEETRRHDHETYLTEEEYNNKLALEYKRYDEFKEESKKAYED